MRACTGFNEREKTEKRVSRMQGQYRSHKSGSVGAAPAVRHNRGRVEVRSPSLNLWGLTLEACRPQGPPLVRAHHRTPHGGNNERSRPKTHDAEGQWQRALTTTASAQSQRLLSLQLQ